jgi:dTMP kinase
MTRGKFIVIDGMDGSGKTTQSIKLIKYLFNKSKKNHLALTREPYTSDEGAEVRRILAESNDPMEKGYKLADLFVSDRKFHINYLIEPLLDRGLHVISDRYKYSTLAYQQTQGVPLEKLMEMHNGLLVPNLTLIFDVSAEIAMQRVSKDYVRGKKEVFEKIEFQEKLRHNYLALKEQLPNENIIIVDASKSIEEVFSQIQAEVDKIL